MKKTIFLFGVLFFTLSGNAQPATESNVKLNTPTAAPPSQMVQDPPAFNVAVANAPGEQLSSISNEQMQYLFKNLSTIDYTFLGAEFSMSADGDNAKGNLMHISTHAAKKLTGDKPKALIFYSAEGNIALQAELYFGDDQLHQYLVFIKDGKPFAANYLAPAGVTFFKQVVGAKVEAAPDGQGQH
ncbi:MAG: hypothetical protein RI894_641 [Bacteroidota bacterium]|jgi:hypothetical protein